MGKIVPLSYAKKKGLTKGEEPKENIVGFSPISFFLSIVAILIEIYIIWKYFGG